MIQVFQYFIFSKQNRLTEALSEPVESLFEAAENDAWTSIRALLIVRLELPFPVFQMLFQDLSWMKKRRKG